MKLTYRTSVAATAILLAGWLLVILGKNWLALRPKRQVSVGAVGTARHPMSPFRRAKTIVALVDWKLTPAEAVFAFYIKDPTHICASAFLNFLIGIVKFHVELLG